MTSEPVTSIFIEENSPRDGIQNETTPFSLEERVALINALSECGFRRIQVGAFVDSRKVPQMASTEKLFEKIDQRPGVTYSALVLNERGMDRALSAGLRHVSFFISASDTHSRKNTNRSMEEGLALAEKAIRRAKERQVAVQGGIMNAFTCRFEGPIPPSRVLGLVRSLLEMGVDEINLADTAGLAHPGQVEGMVHEVANLSTKPLALHLHDTLGFGLANVYAAWRAGASRFDASCGGLGGCPFIPGVSGNIATEDMVHLFESMGVQTGISLSRLSSVIAFLQGKLNRPLAGRYESVASLIPDTPCFDAMRE